MRHQVDHEGSAFLGNFVAHLPFSIISASLRSIELDDFHAALRACHFITVDFDLRSPSPRQSVQLPCGNGARQSMRGVAGLPEEHRLYWPDTHQA